MNAAVQLWINSIDIPWCLALQNESNSEKTLKTLLEDNRGLIGTEIEALLWLRLGLIDRAHGIVQDGRRGVQAYIHSVVHRMEGDYWNSKYWIRQVQDKGLVHSISTSILKALESSHRLELARSLKLVSKNDFDLEAMVDACEKASKNISSPHETVSLLRCVIEAEWFRMFEIATGSPA